MHSPSVTHPEDPIAATAPARAGTLIRTMPRHALITSILLACSLSTGAHAHARADTSPVVELSQSPRIGVWSCWLSSGTRIHAKTLAPAADPGFAIVLTITGGELLEPPGKRGLADAAASAWSLPKEPEGPRAEVVRRYLESQVRFRAVAQTDCLQLILTGPDEDLGLALELARVLVEQPGLDAAAFDARVATLRVAAADAASNPDRLIIDTLRPLSLPASMPAARAIGLSDLTTLRAPGASDDARQWLTGAVMQGAIEIGIASHTPAPDTLALAAHALGHMTPRPRIRGDTLAELRDAPPAPMKESILVRCEPDPDAGPDAEPARACAAVAFLGPHRERIMERRAFALATFIIDARAEAALGPLLPHGGIEPTPRVRTYPVNPGARSSTSMVAIVVIQNTPAPEPKPEPHPEIKPNQPAPDASSPLATDFATLERLITELATIGPLPGELDEAKDGIARILAAQDLSADAWALKLATLTYDGLNPASLASAIDTYQSLTADDVRRTLAEWWSPAQPNDQPNTRSGVTRIVISPK